MSRRVEKPATEPVRDVRAYFERAAQSFDRLYEEQDQGALMRWINRQFRSDIVARFLATCEHVQAVRAASVLDVGCGSGRYLAAFAELGVKRLVGIDQSRPMLDLAARQIALAKQIDSKLVCTDFDHFETDDEFDVVVAMGYFDYQRDPAEVLRHMGRLARHSVIASFPSRHWFRTPLRRLRYKIKNCPVYFYNRDEIVKLAVNAGFAGVAITKLPGAGMDYVAVFSASSAPTAAR